MNGTLQHAQSTVQYDLLLGNLRQLVLTGQQPEKVVRILSRTDLFDHLSPDQILSWASCAQIAGNTSAATKALHYLHEQYPESEEAWIEHRDYLQAINNAEGLAVLRAQCRIRAPQFLELFKVQLQNKDHEVDVPDAPFASMNRESRLLSLYMDIFRGREDCFARQWADKAEGKSGYVPVRRPLTDNDLRDHLAGRRTYGVYLLQSDGRCRLGVIDADLRKDLRGGTLVAGQKAEVRRELAWMLERIPEVAQELELSCVTEFSGSKGYHFWFPVDRSVESAAMRSALQTISSRVGGELRCFGLEVFPKQDSLSGKGLGNLVKLPLGLHRMSGKPSRLLAAKRGDVWQQLDCLKQVRCNNADVLATTPAPTVATILDHPLLRQWKQDWPELIELGTACPLLAQLFAICREGRALSLREERVLFGVVGFLDRRKALLHALLGSQPEYNPHLVDYRLSRLRGTVLGCKKIHALLESSRDYCIFPPGSSYAHPLLYVEGWQGNRHEQSESATNLHDALEQLRQSLDLVTRFLPQPSKIQT